MPFQKGGDRSLLYLAGALNDPEEWEEPERFHVRDPDAYARSFVGFAEPAGGAGDRSRSCPGRDLAFALARAWFRAVRPEGWRRTEAVTRKALIFADVRLARQG